jgi:hypothetical protein
MNRNSKEYKEVEKLLDFSKLEYVKVENTTLYDEIKEKIPDLTDEQIKLVADLIEEWR